VLSIANVKSGAQPQSYYSGGDDYYNSKKEKAPSQWRGELAKELGLEGQVRGEDANPILDGQLPDGQRIHVGGGKRRRGIDLTLNAQKSVSIQALAVGDGRLLEAHERAVSVAMRHAETLARTRDGETTGKLLIASYQHGTSRELDPHLHTHNVVVNLTRKRDGSWRALDNRAFFDQQKLITAIYRAELAREVRALGYQIRLTGKNGGFELAHITPEQIRAFSKRSAQIEASLEQRGLDREAATSKQLERETLATRRPKRNVDRASLGEHWRAKAVELGIERRPLALEPHPKTRIPRESTPLGAVDYAIEHLTERQAAVTENQVVQTALGAGMGYVTAEEIYADLRGREKSGEILRAKGQLTTREMLRAEQKILHIALSGQGQTQRIADRAQVAEHLASTKLNAGQRQAVELIATSPDRVVGVQGRAGTGKTFMLAEVKNIAESKGYKLMGLGPSGRAVQELTAAGVESRTIASFNIAQDKEINAKTVIVIDEAGMVPTHDMRKIFSAAQEHNAKIVVIGDERQLKAVEAGRPFAQLHEHGIRFALMDEIQRQQDPNLREAVREAGQGQIARSLARMQPYVAEIKVDAQRYQAIAKEFAAKSPEDRRQTLVITGTNQARDAINREIRAALGRGDAGQEVKIVRRVDMTKAQAKLVRHYQPGMVVEASRAYSGMLAEKGERFYVESVHRDFVRLQRENGSLLDWSPPRNPGFIAYEERSIKLDAGDRIQFTQGDKTIGYKSRELAEVVAIDAKNDRLHVRRSNGQDIPLPLTRPLTIDYGYAATAHSSQGATVDRVLVDIDTKSLTTNNAAYYVEISRARQEAKIYTNDRTKLPEAVQRVYEKTAALDVANARLLVKNLPPAAILPQKQIAPNLQREP
jgi:conjugative relaxase-like TrwC/TraI family protein